MSKLPLSLVLLSLFAVAPAVSFADDDGKKPGHGKTDDKKDDGKKHDKHDDDDDDSISVDIGFDELPTKVAEAFKKEFPNAKVEDVERKTYRDGKVHYEIEFELKDSDDDDREVEYNEAGVKVDEDD